MLDIGGNEDLFFDFAYSDLTNAEFQITIPFLILVTLVSSISVFGYLNVKGNDSTILI